MSERKYFQDYAALATRFSVGSGAEALEDFDLAALRLLKGAERQEAIELFTARLAAFENDPRVVRALEALDAPGLDAILRKTMQQVNDNGAEAARILWTRTKDEAVLPALSEILTKAANDRTRSVAAAVLADIGLPQCYELLFTALDQENETVRNVATTALMRLVHLSELERRGRSPVSRLGALILNPLRSVRQPATAELRRIVDAVRAGQTAESLGLVPSDAKESPELGQLRQSVFADPRSAGPWKQALAVAAFRTLRDEERQRGVQFLYLLLGQHDVRAVRAIGELGLPEAVPALREAMQSGGGKSFTAAAQETLTKLGNS